VAPPEFCEDGRLPATCVAGSYILVVGWLMPPTTTTPHLDTHKQAEYKHHVPPPPKKWGKNIC